jgi:hypothetical protein
MSTVPTMIPAVAQDIMTMSMRTAPSSSEENMAGRLILVVLRSWAATRAVRHPMLSREARGETGDEHIQERDDGHDHVAVIPEGLPDGDVREHRLQFQPSRLESSMMKKRLI